MLTDSEVARVTDSLRAAGWWFPPDAVRAVDEGRQTYVPLAGRPTYQTDRCRGAVGRALDRTRRGAIEDPDVARRRRAGTWP